MCLAFCKTLILIMLSHETYMDRCIELAERGKGAVAPNPLVGCVIVCDGKIIGEGWHHKYGEAHAEVNAIESVENKDFLRQSTLYVNLEPCVHFGKTPPCADLIIKMKIPHVVIGCLDTFSLVNGKGRQKLEHAGIRVESGILETECRHLNRRFFIFHEQERPYVILKWAETKDGFIDRIRTTASPEKALCISSPQSQVLVHQWRAEESAILVGTNTALLDNPQLTVRLIDARNPLRIVLDRQNRLGETSHLKDRSTATLIFTELDLSSAGNTLSGQNTLPDYQQISFASHAETLQGMMVELYKRNIQSVLVEGGAILLNSFFETGIWDEARIFISKENAGKGVRAPQKPDLPYITEFVGADELRTYQNEDPIRK
jgi:diaminohydroxyphosphoribosylaminopyrimidine deaminase/5-amino-6-(5-phosphoribosylamino)uracil reductase